MKYKTIGAGLGRNERNDINTNFESVDTDIKSLVLSNSSNSTAVAQALTNAANAKSTADAAKATAEGISATASDAKTESMAAVVTATEAKTTAETVRDQFDSVVAEAGSNNPEVVQARGNYTNLNQRLDSTAQQLADKAKQSDVENLQTTKADTTNVNSALDNKRDKTKPIGMNDLDGETLGIIQDGIGGAPVNVLSIPRDHSVTPGKTTFIYEDIQNLFNPQAVTEGVRTNTNGSLLDDVNFYTTGFIPVEAGKTYLLISHGMTTTTGRIIGYDSNQSFLKMLSSGLSITLPGTQLTVDFDGFIRVPFSNSVSKSIVQIVDVAIYNGTYTPYKMTLDEGITISMSALPDGAVNHRLIDSESIESANISRGEVDLTYHTSMTPLVFPEQQLNLFNKEAVKQDVYIAQANGNETANTGYTASDFIRINPSGTYSVAYRNQGAWYDRDKKYLFGIPNITETTMTAPKGAFFMRLSVRKENVDSQMVVEGSSVPSSYQEHFQVKSRGIIEAMEAVRTQNRLTTPEEIARPLLFSGSGKMKLIGDSRTHGSRGTGFAQDGEIIPGTADVRASPNSHSWGNSLRDLLARKYGITVVNYGIAGANSLTIRNIMTSLIEADDDLILMQLGTNDRHNFQSPESTKTNQRAIIEYAHSLGIPVILMSAPPVAVANDNEEIRNFGMFDVDKAMQELAMEYRMEHISNYDGALKYCEYRGITPDVLLADGLHENDAGYDVVFRNVTRHLGISYFRDGVTT